MLTLDLKGDTLDAVVKKIVQLTNKNIIPSNEVRNQSVTSYIQKVKLEKALEQLAKANDLLISEAEGDYFVIDKKAPKTDKNEEQVKNVKRNSLPPGLSICLLYTSPSPRDLSTSRMPSSA